MLASFARRFPTVFAACTAIGIDPATDPIPVSPAAHHCCCGVLTDAHGRATVAGLYAAGEVARTGLHGANRLASNSLLEGLVMGRRAASAVAADLAGPRRLPVSAEATPQTQRARADRDPLQRAITRGASIGRDATGLSAASDTLRATTAAGSVRDRATVEDAALTLLAHTLLTVANTRTQTRGSHVRTDFPDTDDIHQRASLLVQHEGAANSRIHGIDRHGPRVLSTHDQWGRDRYAR